MLKKFTLSAAAAAVAFVALPAAAQARHNDYGNRYEQSVRYDRYGNRGYDDRGYDSRGYDSRYSSRGYDDRGYSNRGYDDGYGYRGNNNNRCSGTTGTIVGGVAGALGGRAIDRSGNRYSRRGSGTTGAILGGAIGALVGRSVDKSSCNNDRRYYR